jgi:hypothetical protein
MPTGPECPYCHESPPDWFREWYTPSEATQLFQGLMASDCPNPECGKKVWLRWVPETIDQTTPLLARSLAQADAWVKSQKPQYQTIQGFLQANDPAAQAYKNDKFRP